MTPILRFCEHEWPPMQIQHVGGLDHRHDWRTASVLARRVLMAPVPPAIGQYDR